MLIPSLPNITLKQIIDQLWVDISGKEVQEAATYSYLWLAIQVAHAGLLIALHLLLLRVVLIYRPELSTETASLFSLVALMTVTAFWEVASFWRVWRASRVGRFPVNTRGIARNATIATVYMWIGALLGHASQLQSSWTAVGLTLGLLVLFNVAAIPWLREKITWQKSALPYVSRLATTGNAVASKDIPRITRFVKGLLPPEGTPQHVILFGVVGSGRTQLAAAMGTELAFAGAKVRYLAFDRFRGLLRDDREYPGPRNIHYWPWRDAQVLIIDDVSPSMMGSDEQASEPLCQRFQRFIDHQTEHLGTTLGERSTLWVVGDDADYTEWQAAVQQACQCESAPDVVILDSQ